MTDQKVSQDRANLLADVAEMYYLKGMNQADIAESVGVTRSMVSRMLKEAHKRGIVDIRVNRPLQSEHELEKSLIDHFGLREAFVIAVHKANGENLLPYIGKAGAQILKRYITPSSILGIAWGTTVSATVDQVEYEEPLPITIAQLVGALGARNAEYDGHDLVSRLARELGSDGYYLNAPFLCQNPETARSLMETSSIKETINIGKRSSVALLGVGSTEPKYSSFYLAGYVPIEELDHLRKSGAVGDVCGIHFDIDGQDVCKDFCERLVAIQKSDLLSIPIRIGVAGGKGKAVPILGALRGGYLNVLVTDSQTARRVLEFSRLE